MLINILLLAVVIYFIHSIVGQDSIPASPLSSINSDNLFKKILMGALIAPIIEEIAFRLHLSANKRDILLSVLFGSAISISQVSSFPILSPYPIIIGVALTAVLYALAFSNLSIFKNFSRFYKKNLLTFILISTLIFSFLHIADYNNFQKYGITYTVYMLPSFTMGVLLCITRIKCGISYSILFHCTHNSLLLVPTLIVLSKS